MTDARVAVISDIHGVLPVLEAVLAEPDVRSADRIVVCGDHLAGPQPAEVLETLVVLGDRAVLVRGNADRELVELRHGALSTEDAPAESVWAAEQLTTEQLDLLDGLPHPLTLPVEGFGDVLACHATPRNDTEIVLVDSRLERWAEVLGDVDAGVRLVLCGHTHMPFVRLVDRRTVANPGSLGMPYGSPLGSWLLLDRGTISVRRTEVDADAVADRVVAESGYPDVVSWADEYLRHPASDIEAVAAFGPRDGRL